MINRSGLRVGTAMDSLSVYPTLELKRRMAGHSESKWMILQGAWEQCQPWNEVFADSDESYGPSAFLEGREFNLEWGTYELKEEAPDIGTLGPLCHAKEVNVFFVALVFDVGVVPFEFLIHVWEEVGSGFQEGETMIQALHLVLEASDFRLDGLDLHCFI
ncbi:hypothetical protein NDU88_001851 [Pleurodeles waltl]|uniref:Uncharacterized protein n=1 Tax=Pleurodeles waltl TaxID=8319 RepID=A0AAV7RE63_PLEWA|nr:hypothetical protein NDU88_001851 [Pleurodeles waltl]